jgi:hypothetical protein
LKRYILIAVVAVIGTSLLTYFFGPRRTEIREVEKIVLKEVRVEQKDKNKITKREITRSPSGELTIREETREVESTRGTTETTAQKDTTKVVKRVPAPSWNIQAGIGTSPGNNFAPQYFGSISKQILGPFSVGAWATGSSVNDLTVGGSIGITF